MISPYGTSTSKGPPKAMIRNLMNEPLGRLILFCASVEILYLANGVRLLYSMRSSGRSVGEAGMSVFIGSVIFVIAPAVICLLVGIFSKLSFHVAWFGIIPAIVGYIWLTVI